MAKTWFITGASRGFGREWAEAALERGDNVAATARDTDALQPLVGRYGEAVLPLGLDVTDRGAAFDAVRQAASHFGSLDVVVNNAGYGHFAMVEELGEADIRAEMETNFFGALWVTQAALPIMRGQGSGRILQVTSEGGIRAFPQFGAYHASKWALEGLSQSMSQEVRDFGIRVTMVEPGPYATGFGSTGLKTSEPNPAYDTARAGYQSAFAALELGTPGATRGLILQVVDAEEPPLRVFVGKSLGPVTEEYEQRLTTWREWEAASLEAFGEEQGHPERLHNR